MQPVLSLPAVAAPMPGDVVWKFAQQRNRGEAELAILVSTYQRPRHLSRCLTSLLGQTYDLSRAEIVVTDDGSTDDTLEIVAQFAEQAPCPVKMTTHPHDGFQLSRCRNDGVRASSAPYLLFLDGDCVLPRDHLQIHVEQRRPNTVTTSHFCELDAETSEGVTEEQILQNRHMQLASSRSRWRLWYRSWKCDWYNLRRHRYKHSLVGNNVGIWRADYERVNGYDERFRGWGCEDNDLGDRLQRAGVRIRSILRQTYTLHLWHPPSQGKTAKWRHGTNVQYLLHGPRPTFCEAGLKQPQRPVAQVKDYRLSHPQRLAG